MIATPTITLRRQKALALGVATRRGFFRAPAVCLTSAGGVRFFPSGNATSSQSYGRARCIQGLQPQGSVGHRRVANGRQVRDLGRGLRSIEERLRANGRGRADPAQTGTVMFFLSSCVPTAWHLLSTGSSSDHVARRSGHFLHRKRNDDHEERNHLTAAGGI